MAVGTLSAGAVASILRSRLGRALPRPVLLRVHEAAGGNPFYALELARALPRELDPTEPLPVPPTLDSLVGARVSDVPARTRDALLLAAVDGRLAGRAVAPAALGPALRAGIVDVSGGTIRFTHPLLASAVYAGASPNERAAAHARAAELAGDPVARARHAALAAREPDAELASALDEAATAAIGRGAPHVAAELAEHALRVTPPGEELARQARVLAAVRAHFAAGSLERARTLGREAVELEAPRQASRRRRRSPRSPW